MAVRKKSVKTPRVPRTRNANTWTEAEFWSKIRNSLRNISRFYKPGMLAKAKAKRVYKGPNKKQRVEYVCNSCKQGFPTNAVQIHHKKDCGSLKSYSDLPGFVERMFAEDINAYEILCLKCHKEHHLEQHKLKKNT